MKRYNYRYLLFLVALLSACATLQQTSLQERIGYGYAALASARTTTASLLERDRISLADAKRVQVQADQVRQTLDNAQALAKSGDTVKAYQWVDAANKQLLEVEKYLKAREANK